MLFYIRNKPHPKLPLGSDIAVSTMLHVFYHLHWLDPLDHNKYPAQLEFTEGATLKQVQGMMAGIGIYSAGAQPDYFNIYGIGHPLLHFVVSQLMGNTLLAGRLASAALIVLSSLLMLAMTMRKTSPINAVVLTTFFYAACTTGRRLWISLTRLGCLPTSPASP